MKLHPSTFVAQTDSVFAQSLADCGFTVDGEDHEDDWHACRRYRAGDRYIEIAANCHFRDGDPECRMILGHGSNDWPDSDWNKIAIWRLRGSGGNYPLTSIDEIPKVLNKMLRDLQHHAQDFLDGDVNRFLETLAAQTREREPYKTYTPQPDGSYKTIIDPESQALKDRYSNPKKA